MGTRLKWGSAGIKSLILLEPNTPTPVLKWCWQQWSQQGTHPAWNKLPLFPWKEEPGSLALRGSGTDWLVCQEPIGWAELSNPSSLLKLKWMSRQHLLDRTGQDKIAAGRPPSSAWEKKWGLRNSAEHAASCSEGVNKEVTSCRSPSYAAACIFSAKILYFPVFQRKDFFPFHSTFQKQGAHILGACEKIWYMWKLDFKNCG